MTVILSLLLAARVAAPTLSPAGGSYTSAQAVTVSSPATGDAIYCTTDGSQPRRVAGQRYAGPISLPASATVRCRSFALDGRDPSREVSAAYTIAPAQPLTGWAATCAAEPEPTSNVIYVCDCQPGADPSCAANNSAANDANAGATKATPKRTWGSARTAFRSLPAGGTVALCRGGRFSATDSGGYTAWQNNNCSTSGRCTLRDYLPTWGNAGTAAPVVEATGADTTAIQIAGGVAYSGLRFLNLTLLRTPSGTSLNGDGIRVWDWGDNVEVCNMTIDGFAVGVYVGTGSGTCPAVNIRGNRIINNCTHGILASQANSDIDGNYFDNNGHALCGSYDLLNQSNGTTHSIYEGGGGSCLKDNVRIVNNEIRRNALQSGAPQGSPLVLRGRAVDFTIENNLIDMTPLHPSMSGGGIFGGNGDVAGPDGLTRLAVRRNRIVAGRQRQIGLSAVVNGVIEDNLIVAPGTPDTSDLIAVPHEQGVLQSTSAVVRNNTIYVTGSAPSGLAAIRVATTSATTGNIVTGNSVTFAAGGSGECFRADDPAKVAMSANNQCTGGTIGFGSAITPPLAGLFVNAPTDLTPAAGSPLVGAGSTATGCTVLGVANQPCTSPIAIDSPTWSPTAPAKSRDAAPDIGAMER